MTYKYEKRLNKEHCYLLFITILAIVSLVGNAAQNRNCDEIKKSYERELKTIDNTYLELQDKYLAVKNQLKIITDEYNDLLEKNK